MTDMDPIVCITSTLGCTDYSKATGHSAPPKDTDVSGTNDVTFDSSKSSFSGSTATFVFTRTLSTTDSNDSGIKFDDIE